MSVVRSDSAVQALPSARWVIDIHTMGRDPTVQPEARTQADHPGLNATEADPLQGSAPFLDVERKTTAAMPTVARRFGNLSALPASPPDADLSVLRRQAVDSGTRPPQNRWRAIHQPGDLSRAFISCSDWLRPVAARQRQSSATSLAFRCIQAHNATMQNGSSLGSPFCSSLLQV